MTILTSLTSMYANLCSKAGPNACVLQAVSFILTVEDEGERKSCYIYATDIGKILGLRRCSFDKDKGL